MQKRLRPDTIWYIRPQPFPCSGPQEALAEDLAGVGDDEKRLGIMLLEVTAQGHGLSPGEGGEDHPVFFVGIGALALPHRGG